MAPPAALAWWSFLYAIIYLSLRTLRLLKGISNGVLFAIQSHNRHIRIRL